MDLESVEAALDALEADGARGFDGPACDCIRTLIVQAERLGGGVAERLLVRADAHLRALAERLTQDRARVHSQLTAFEAHVDEAMPELHRQLEGGDTTRVARTLRRLRQRPKRRVPSMALAKIDPNVNGTPGPGRRSRITVRQRQALAYEDSVAELVASFALARAVDVVPEDAGPYNALRIASEALDKMRALSPFYLTVQLNRLEELASLLSLPELPERPSTAPTPSVLPRKKRGALKGSA